MSSTSRNAENFESLIGEPLDTLHIRVNSKNGIQTTVSALHIGFMETRCYVQFRPPPFITSDTTQDSLTADEEEWLESAAFLEDDLHWILRLPYNRFWSQVVFDEELHRMLESYLSQAPRDYDIVNLHMKDEVLCSLKKIHKLVFLVYLRMSTYKESKTNHIRPEVFGSIIYDKFVFDVPKIMDMCVLYGFQNPAIIQKIVQNIFSTQPNYLEDLNQTSLVILEAFNTIEEKLSTNSYERKGDADKDPVNHLSAKKKITVLPLHDVINYITDVSATLHAFLEIYSPACQAFFQNDGPVRIATFYEQAFCMIEKEIAIRKTQIGFQSILEEIKRKVALSKTLLLKIFRNILNYCCIQYVLSSNCNSNAQNSYESSHAEHFLEIFTVLASEKNFLHDYNILYPFEADLELFNEVGLKLDPERLCYIFCSIHESGEGLPEKFVSTASNGARPKTKKLTGETVQTMQGVAAILRRENSQDHGKSSSSSTDLKRNGFTGEEINSLIQSIKDVFSELGEGFIEKCLQHFDYSTEKVIHTLLNNDELPDHLLKLDRNLKRELHQGTSSDYSILSERKNVYDNDEFDIFNRDDVDMSRVHMGKKNKTPSSYEALGSSKDTEFLKELTLKYGSEDTDLLDHSYVYEDEYDDTYDSAMVGLKEPAPEGVPAPEEDVNDNNFEESINELAENSRDSSKDFCINPEISRERAEQRRQSKISARRGGRRDAPSSDQPQHRQQKDRNKAHVGNHNRRKQADFKRSRGMGPLS